MASPSELPAYGESTGLSISHPKNEHGTKGVKGSSSDDDSHIGRPSSPASLASALMQTLTRVGG